MEQMIKQGLLVTAVEQAAEIFVITGIDWTIHYANPAFASMTGYAQLESLGQSLMDLLNLKPDGKVHGQIYDALSIGSIWKGRFSSKKKDDQRYDVEATFSPVRDEKGNIVNYVCVVRDVTILLALETQLRQAQKLESIGQLAAGIAHEINTPTQYVGDNTRFLQDSFSEMVDLLEKLKLLVEAIKSGDETSGLLDEIEQSMESADLEYLINEIPLAIEQTLEGVGRVAKIVRAMKEFSHPGSEDKTLVEINNAIASTVTVSRNEWKYVAELVEDYDESLLSVPCLPGEFNQVILNMIINAAHAIADVLGNQPEAKGTITISTKNLGDWAEIRITDTGTGIPAHAQPKIFDPFFTTKEVGKGTGQGLAIAHSVIVEKHEGTLTFETIQDKGTTFVISLPMKIKE